jgi:hypothetical protein
MSTCKFLGALLSSFAIAAAQSLHAQLSKGHLILIERGLQLQGLVTKDDVFHLNTFSNANYTSINWLWESSPSQMGAAPGFLWGRWVNNTNQMPPTTSEVAYTNQLISLQLADERFIGEDAVRTEMVEWFDSVRSNWPNTLLYINNYAGQAPDWALADFFTRAHPDMICFDNYPFEETLDTGEPYALWTSWYSELRRYRDNARNFKIPFATYRQTFHAEERPTRVYRDPSASELRLNTFAALAFNAKMLVDFTYNTGASSLFTKPGGDSYPTPLYTEMTDINRRARNLGKALVRLQPIDEATPQWTTSLMFLRGKNSSGNPNPIPINFIADPDAPNSYTDWVADRNDPYLRGFVVTNKGTKNNGFPGDVIIAWFKPLDESFDGTNFTNQIYMMVVNALSDPTGSPADCLQEIKLNFQNVVATTNLIMLDSATGQLQTNALPVVNTRRQLVLNLNGGDAVLFKFNTGAPFVGFSPTQPAKLNLQKQSGALQLELHGNVAMRYQLETTQSLANSNWTVLTNFLLPSSPHVLSEPIDPNTNGFFRLIENP